MALKTQSYVEENTKISGVTYIDPASGLSRQEIIMAHVTPGTRLQAVPEDNPHDPNAVALWLDAMGKRYHIGYVPASRARYLAPKLRDGLQVEVVVMAVTGGTPTKPTRGVNIALRYGGSIGTATGRQADVQKPHGCGWYLWRLALIAAGLFVALVCLGMVLQALG
jgi:hypothetical protein